MTTRVLEVSALFREYASLVERVLRRAGVQERDVPDARQEVFLVAHRRLSEFEGRAQPSTWLCAIAIRVASDFRRKAHRRRERPEEAQGRAESVDTSQSALLEQRDDLLQALDALEHVAPPQREVFVLFELFELPMNEVAARVGCPSKTAFSRLYAARRQLQAELRKRGLVAGAGGWLLSSPSQGPWSAVTHAHAALRTVREACAYGAGGSWSPWLVGAATFALILAAPDAGSAPTSGSITPPIQRSVDASASVARQRVAATPAPLEAAAAPSPPPHAARERPRAVRLHRRAPALQPSVAEIATPAPATASGEEFRVTRAGAHDPAPVGEHPWADLLQPQARIPARLRLRGPADPATAAEQELRDF